MCPFIVDDEHCIIVIIALLFVNSFFKRKQAAMFGLCFISSPPGVSEKTATDSTLSMND